MSISMGGQTLLSTSLHQMPQIGRWQNSPLRTSVYGVSGVVEISDEFHGREIRIDCTYSGYSSWALLEAAIAVVEAKIKTLRDKTLTVVVGGVTLTFPHCSFDSVERLPNPRDGRMVPYYDGSAVTAWRCELALVFFQLDATA